MALILSGVKVLSTDQSPLWRNLHFQHEAMVGRNDTEQFIICQVDVVLALDDIVHLAIIRPFSKLGGCTFCHDCLLCSQPRRRPETLRDSQTCFEFKWGKLEAPGTDLDCSATSSFAPSGEGTDGIGGARGMAFALTAGFAVGVVSEATAPAGRFGTLG